MAYNEKLAARVKEALAQQNDVEEQPKMGGISFNVNGKFCIRVINDELMCRIGPEVYEVALEKKGCKEWYYKGKPMKGYVVVDPEGTKSKKDLDYWINLCLQFNPKAKSSKKK